MSLRKTLTRVIAGVLAMVWILVAVWLGIRWMEEGHFYMPMAAFCGGAVGAWKLGRHAMTGYDGQ